MRRIVFLLFPGFELLDFAGPVQVFHESRKRGFDLELLFCSSRPHETCEQGLTIGELQPYPEFQPDDLVVVPGFTLDITPVPWETVGVVKKALAARSRIVASCSGAFVLGHAGVLNGRVCTTHWKRIAELKQTFPEARVADERLFIEDGRVITGGGGTCGIDLALHLVEEERGPLFVSKVAREMLLYVRRDRDALQTSVYLDYRSHQNPGVHAVQDWLIEHPDQGADIETLADIAHMSGRNLTRVFRQVTGISPGEYRTQLRLERANVLLKNPHLTVEAVAAEVGFKDARTLRRLWSERYTRSPRTSRSAAETSTLLPR
jgi:transcriptional regulator GlxA family with amidase domain